MNNTPQLAGAPPQTDAEAIRAEYERVLRALKTASGEDLMRLHHYCETLSWQCVLLGGKQKR
jgi:hypothetical protein